MTEFYDKYLKYKSKYLDLKIELDQEGGVPNNYTLVLYNNTTPFGIEMNKIKNISKSKKKYCHLNLTNQKEPGYKIPFTTLYGNTSTFEYNYGTSELTPIFIMGNRSLLTKNLEISREITPKKKAKLQAQEMKLRNYFLQSNGTKVCVFDENKCQSKINESVINNYIGYTALRLNSLFLERVQNNISLVQPRRIIAFNSLLTFYKENLIPADYAHIVTIIPNLNEKVINEIKHMEDNKQVSINKTLVSIDPNNFLTPNDMVLILKEKNGRTTYRFRLIDPFIVPDVCKEESHPAGESTAGDQ